jgi:hypothetical protein
VDEALMRSPFGNIEVRGVRENDLPERYSPWMAALTVAVGGCQTVQGACRLLRHARPHRFKSNRRKLNEFRFERAIGNPPKLWVGQRQQRLKELGIELPAPPEPFGTYAEAVQRVICFF